MIPILADIGGSVRFERGGKQTMREETDRNTGIVRKVVVEHKGDLHPQIVIEDKDENPLGLYPHPRRRHIEVDDGEEDSPARCWPRPRARWRARRTSPAACRA